MVDLVVIGFENEHQAEEVGLTLLKLQSEYLIDLEDAVVAVKKPDGNIRLLQSQDLTAVGAVQGGFGARLLALFSLARYSVPQLACLQAQYLVP